MKKLWTKVLAVIVLAGAGVMMANVGRAMPGAKESPPAALEGIRFVTLDVFVDAGSRELAAYQIELVPHAGGEANIVGLYGGERRAFEAPPFYDPAALNAANSRLVIAAYSTAAGVPTGRSRVARVAVAYMGPHFSGYSARVVTAAGPDGRVLPAMVAVVEAAGAPMGAMKKGPL